MEKPDITKMEKLEASGKQGKKPTKSKKSKDPEPLTEEQLDKLPKLPKNWKWVSHSEIAIINPPKPDGNELLEVSFLPMPAVEEETGRYSLSETRKLGEVRKGYTGFIEGDVIFAKITPCMENGKVAYLEKLVNEIGFGSTEFHVSRPTSGIFGKYLFHYFVQQTFRKEAKRSMTGSAGQLRVPSSYFAEQPFPLAPLPEQRAIVSKIEQLFSELDNGISNLKLAQEQLKVYRQAVLKKAFEGELTKKWREQQTDLLDAIDLLKQIRKEKEKAAKVSRKKVKSLNPLTEEELEDLNRLPKEWNWIKIGDITLGVEYGTSAKSKESGDIAVLRMGNIQNGRFDWNDLVYTSDKAEIENYLLKKDDVLFNRTNSPELVGKTAIYKGERPAIFAGYLIRINQLPELVVADYLNYFLNCPIAKVHGNFVKTDGVNQSNINGEKLRNYPFPFCSISEQNTIVQEIETRLSVCDKIEQDIKENLEKAEALRQSILKKAFEGKLLNEKELAEVRGAKDWEPAEVLLEKIKTENEGNGKKRKQASEKLKTVVLDDRELTQQYTLEVFDQVDK